MAVTNTFADGSSITAAQLNQNFSDLVAALNQVRTQNIAADAGILATQLAERYVAYDETIILLPWQQSATLAAAPGAGALWTLPAATTLSLHKKKITARSGQELYLCVVELYVATVNVAGGDPSFQIQKNGVTIGGGAVAITTGDSYYRLPPNGVDAIANPLVSAQDGDEFVLQLVVAGGSTCTIGGVFCRLVWKRALSS